MSEGNGRIALLGDHKPPRPTKAEVEKQMADDIAKIATEAAIKVTEFYMQQFPELVARMLAEAFAANGLTMKPPPAATDTVAEPQ